MKIVIVGAGWGGIAAAYEARTKCAEVVLIEKTDMILGTGLVGGIMRNNGRFTVLEELKIMGLSRLIELIDDASIHRNINFPGHNHASFYDVTKIESKIRSLLEEIGVTIVLKERISKISINHNTIISVISDKGNIYEGDVFIDTTGTAGPMNNCIKYGNGCSMCVLRCPTYKGRISLTGLCNIKEMQGQKKDGSIGSMSGSCEILKESLASNIAKNLNKNGFVLIPLNNELIEDHLDLKACQQYALEEYKKNLILLDTGHAKLMMPYYSLKKLRSIKGFENTRYIDPYSGGVGNSMRFFDIAPHTNSLQVIGVTNLLCAGEKAGLVGHTEAIMTGILAGYNALKICNNEELLILPRTTCSGEAIAYTNEQLYTNDGITKKYTVSGSILFDRIQNLKLYTNDIEEIKKRIGKTNLENIFNNI